MLTVCVGGMPWERLLLLPCPRMGVGTASSTTNDWDSPPDRCGACCPEKPVKAGSLLDAVCMCLVSKETHIAENVQCFTKSTKQRSLQGPSSLLLQSNRKKLKWQRRCASTSLCHRQLRSLVAECYHISDSVTTSLIQCYHMSDTVSPHLWYSITTSDTMLLHLIQCHYISDSVSLIQCCISDTVSLHL